jgi:hypothetical protein
MNCGGGILGGLRGGICGRVARRGQFCSRPRLTLIIFIMVKVGKSAERLFSFYRLHFNFHEPYTIILDGNSLCKMLTNGQDYQKMFRKLAKDTVRVKVTDCIRR